MNFDGVGLHPDNAIKIVLGMYDGKSTKDKISLLLNNRPIAKLNSIDLPANFASGTTIDLNAGELMGLGAVVSYYQWVAEQAGTKNTYQAFVGIEDSAKAQTENVLSDGAIWHDQAHAKMLVQQVMVQGYFPATKVSNAHVITQINKKAARRADYPDNCALIVNIYSQAGEIEIEGIRKGAKQAIEVFADVYVVWYQLPALDIARVIYLSKPTAPNLTIALARYEHDDVWHFNVDSKRSAKPIQ
ncbi:MAG: hypothetical protein KIH63_001740 [Candidatus Saccharibacteria bacterium]|nr:hypothetical protein [Candidatus Saccharibacteria bacterium]